MDRNMSGVGRLTRRSPSPSRGGPKLRMDRKPNHVRINDPSHPAGKRKEIDNVMRKARAFPNETWDKKLLEVEEKDPNRWRHTGFKKMYIEDDPSSSDSERGSTRFGNGPPMVRRSRSRSPRTPPLRHRRSPSPPMRKRRPLPVSPSPPPPMIRRRPVSLTPPPPEPVMKRRPRSPPPRMMRRQSPLEFHRKSPISVPDSPRRGPIRRMSPGPPPRPRTKRPPSPPPKMSRSPSMSSCSDESCSACSADERHRRTVRRSRSISGPRSRLRGATPPMAHVPKSRREVPGLRPMSPPPMDPRRKEPIPKVHRIDKDPRDRPSRPIPPPPPVERYRHPQTPESEKDPSPKPVRVAKHKPIQEEPRPAKVRHPKPSSAEVASASSSRKHKVKHVEKLRTRVKIEGEPKQRRPRSPSSGSEDSSSSESSLPRFTATTRLSLSERFGKMAQWSVDRSNMENMRITKNSSGGDLKVMIEEETEAPPPVRYTYSPAPAGHFPEELMTTGPSGLSSWDDVRVRYEYYKGRGYLRDLDLQDYIKWEEWWYKYQEWLKQERYYELWERSQMNRRRKKVPISQRLN
ncbi:serine/arginine repetitive matrix protein 1-like [Malaya genurostris]|uniref:serine/arginine repetitive matrix protein 1-like n=1 Tax=Malaya genurostris TaxID=325434 RepID=UPI0026F3F970|nr:serine/arginine repetitive matrix protein 1-like [Malaya genurostris]XP_058452312.1 serine/arginine repetitive matrix protein 1-like [Malaya genurostris]